MRSPQSADITSTAIAPRIRKNIMRFMEALLKRIFALTPLIWGVAFVAPLIAQIWMRMDWTIPFALTPLTFGWLIGGSWGLYAQIRGTWFWKGERNV